MFAINSSCSESNKAHIADIDNPRDAFLSLERRHGMNSGIATAGVISKIINSRIDELDSIDTYISELQGLHSQLHDLTHNNRKFQMSDELLGLFLLINLPRERYSFLTQQLLGNLDNISTQLVFSRLLTEFQLHKAENQSSNDALALHASDNNSMKSIKRIGAKSKYHVKDPNAPCHLLGHAGSRHTNGECIAQKPRSKTKPPKRRFPTPQRPVESSKAMAVKQDSSVTQENDSDNEQPQVLFSNAYAIRAVILAEDANELIIDSGADRHIINNASLFSSLVNIKPVSIQSANRVCNLMASQQGTVPIKSLDSDGIEHSVVLNNVLLCEQIMVNLVLATILCDEGFKLKADAVSLCFLHPDKNALHATQVANSFALWTLRVSHKSQASSFSTSHAFNARSDLLHQWLANLHSAALRRFCQGNSDIGPCTSCVLSKSFRRPFTSSFPISSRPLHRIHSNLLGPMPCFTPSGNRYIVSFIDDMTRFNRIFVISKKSDVFRCFETFVEHAEAVMNLKVCFLKTHRGGEYVSHVFKHLCDSKGIELEQGPAITPQHNGVSERFNRTLLEKIRAQLIHANLPDFLWGELALATSFLINLSPMRSTGEIPLKLWNDCCDQSGNHKINYDFLKVLGCAAYPHVHKSSRNKLEPTSQLTILVSYEPGSNPIVSGRQAPEKSSFPVMWLSSNWFFLCENW